MSLVIVIARVRLRPDNREESLALLTEIQEASRADDGCLNYGYYTDIADPESLVAVEEWRHMAALQAHLRTPHVARLLEALPDSVAAPPEIVVHEVASSGPLPL